MWGTRSPGGGCPAACLRPLAEGPPCPPQAALSETGFLCREYSWLAEICRFVHGWGPGQLEAMRGWPSEEYVNRIAKLRVWMSRITEVPRSVVTSNRLLYVDCTGIHQDICMWRRRGRAVGEQPPRTWPHWVPSAPPSPAVPLLAAINEDILSLLLREATQRSELLIAEMSAVLQLYLSVSSDIFTIAKCSQKVSGREGGAGSRTLSTASTRGFQAPPPTPSSAHGAGEEESHGGTALLRSARADFSRSLVFGFGHHSFSCHVSRAGKEDGGEGLKAPGVPGGGGRRLGGGEEPPLRKGGLFCLLSSAAPGPGSWHDIRRVFG